MTNTAKNNKVYRDFSSLTKEVIEKKAFAGGAKKDNYFPVKLHYVLREMENDGLQHIASWQPHGRSFVVHDQEQFVKDVLVL